MKQLEAIIKKIFTLKPISPLVHKLLAALQNPDGSLSDFAELISYDAALTANLLKLANSSYFGSKQKINSVHQACSFLGMDKVLDLVFMTCCAENLVPSYAGYGLEQGELWKNATSTALMARQLSEKETGIDSQLVFTAALLKDIGKVVLSQFVGKAFLEICTLVTEGAYSFSEAEKQVIGIDHAELGALVARTWRFSAEMQDIIHNHHHPLQASTCIKETSIVHVADTLCMMMGIGIGRDGLSYRFDQKVVAQLCMTEKELEKAIVGFSEIYNQVEDLVSRT